MTSTAKALGAVLGILVLLSLAAQLFLSTAIAMVVMSAALIVGIYAAVRRYVPKEIERSGRTICGIVAGFLLLLAIACLATFSFPIVCDSPLRPSTFWIGMPILFTAAALPLLSRAARRSISELAPAMLIAWGFFLMLRDLFV
jgi:hypothetical protein